MSNPYVTPARVEELEPGLTIDDPDGFALLVDRAARDVDALLGPWPRYASLGGFKVDVANLAEWEAEALELAVSAQAVYLLEAAPRIDAGARVPVSIKGPDFEEQYGTGGGTIPRYSPRTLTELEPLRRLYGNGARARP